MAYQSTGFVGGCVVLKVLDCIAFEHDLRLVALSALICVLGCLTTVTIMARIGKPSASHPTGWPLAASIVFGSSVWSLHFVAMLAFKPASQIYYDFGLTALSAVAGSAGAFAALLVWQSPWPSPARIVPAGCLLGLSVTSMHYVGVDAMSASSLISYDWSYVAASVVVSVVCPIIAFARATDLARSKRRLEVSGWLCVGICGLHFTAMSAVTIMPVAPLPGEAGLFGTTALAVAVGGVSVGILIASLIAAIVDQHMSQRALQELGRMRLLSNLAQEALLIHRNGVVLEINQAGERLLKAEAGDIVGRSMTELFTQESLPALVRRAACAPKERQPEELEIQAIDGTRASVELTCQPVDFMGKPATVVALRDLTDRRRDEVRIRHLARHDALTNLPNRYALLERLDFALEAAAQHRTALAVIYIDLDRFKPVNDLYGHAVGDALLIQVSKRLLAETQVVDTLARIGGDELVLLLAGGSQPERSSIVATRIIDVLGKPFLIEGHRIEIGASVGIALYPDDGGTADSLMRAADAAMYRAKEEGRNALRFFEASMNAQLQTRLQLQQELSFAIEQGELALHYQPIVNGVTGEIETFEALIRWNHPSRGMVPPLDFIPLAEQNGMIDSIGRWVIEMACGEAARWPRPWRVAVNVSPRQFSQSDICATIAQALRTHAIAPARLVIEVTEGVLIEDATKAVAILNRLRDLGVRIALDDFGTGYSSLNYLQLFKFDKFKIDKSFIRKLTESDDALTLTRTIINLGHNLGLNVTAEGVETAAQLAVLQRLGCDQIQGYLIGRPAPVVAFTERDRRKIAALFHQDDLALLI